MLQWCDVRNADSMKKAPVPETPRSEADNKAESTLHVLSFDSFGPAPVASIGNGYLYLHLARSRSGIRCM